MPTSGLRCNGIECWLTLLPGVDEEYHLYARHDKASETLETDSKLAAMGHKNPVLEKDAPANK
jgi:hypothetical protein